MFQDCLLSGSFGRFLNHVSDLVHMFRIRDITKQVAAAVVKEAIEEDLAEGYREMDGRELRKLNQVFFLSLKNVMLNMKLVYDLRLKLAYL